MSTQGTNRVDLTNDEWLALIRELSYCACRERTRLMDSITDLIRQDGQLTPDDSYLMPDRIKQYQRSADHQTGPILRKLMDQLGIT